MFAEHDYSEFDFSTSSGKVLQKHYVLAYISGFVSGKFIQRQTKSCDSLIDQFLSKADDSLEVQLIRLKQHSRCQVGLQYPSQRLVNAIVEAEQVYCKLAKKVIYMRNVKYKLVSSSLDQCTYSLLWLV